MRYTLEFELENNVIPIEYRRAIISFIKKSLELYDNALFKKYYESHEIKPFTFAVRLTRPKFDTELITLDNSLLEISFSTSESMLGIQAYNAFSLQRNKKFNMRNNNMVLKRVIIQKDLKVNSEDILIKMLSPIVLREHSKNHDFYYSVKHKDFERVWSNQIKYQLERLLVRDVGGLLIKKVRPQMVVVKHYDQFIESSIGSYVLKGAPHILQTLYDAGMGSKSSAGFGMFEVLKQ
ncbi:MAG: CRISPR-associated endoribonuclease Cas6 [Bacillota bacterium]